MRRALWIVAAGLVLTAPLLAADDAQECKAIVEKAIKAAGGTTNLLKIHAATWKNRGPSEAKNNRLMYGEMPDKIRFEWERVEDGKVVHTIKILNGDRGWNVRDGVATPLTPEQLANSQATMYQKSLGYTILPLRDPNLKLSLAGESVVNGKPAVGIKVVKPNMPDVVLYFDKVSGLPAKSIINMKDRQTGAAVKQEINYAHHKDIDGAKVPSRIINFIDGREAYTVDLVEFHAKGKLDEKLFLPPPPPK
jgi:hypothetical protein